MSLATYVECDEADMAHLKLLSAKMIDLRDEEKEMKSSGGRTFITAVIFSTLLIMSSGVQASSLFSLDGNSTRVERQIGLFQQALQWLSGTWTDFKVAFSADGTNGTPPSPPPTCTSNCADDDSGWTIDPEG
jgi:hypothetical protein